MTDCFSRTVNRNHFVGERPFDSFLRLSVQHKSLLDNLWLVVVPLDAPVSNLGRRRVCFDVIGVPGDWIEKSSRQTFRDLGLVSSQVDDVRYGDAGFEEELRLGLCSREAVKHPALSFRQPANVVRYHLIHHSVINEVTLTDYTLDMFSQLGLCLHFLSQQISCRDMHVLCFLF